MSKQQQLVISPGQTLYYVSTDYPKIGTEYPMYYTSLGEAIAACDDIRKKGFSVRIYLRKTIEVEELLLDYRTVTDCYRG